MAKVGGSAREAARRRAAQERNDPARAVEREAAAYAERRRLADREAAINAERRALAEGPKASREDQAVQRIGAIGRDLASLETRRQMALATRDGEVEVLLRAGWSPRRVADLVGVSRQALLKRRHG